ncbi:hypothetical protein TIFTF001_032882 [Ficus carica]|uniref:Uncharacterized protein n=1 Tax=Ficus carica TaxID=3494 RepID=A0AA88DXH8_FICCA|nr:hypothetical protein TIFTF001_032882 [Ficus carica]
MPKISGTTHNVITSTKLVLHSCSTSSHLQKEKHIEVIGTPASSANSGVRVTQSDRLPSVPDGQIGLRRIGAIVTGFTSYIRWWMECCDRGPLPVTRMVPRARGSVQSSRVVPGYNLTRYRSDRAPFGFGRTLSHSDRFARVNQGLLGSLRLGRVLRELSSTQPTYVILTTCRVVIELSRSVKCCRELLIEIALPSSPRRTEKVNPFTSSPNMSDQFSDSENAQLFGDVNVTRSSSSILSTSSDTTGEAAAPRDLTLDNLSGMSDIPSPNREFVEDLNGATQAQPAPVVDLTAGTDEASERTGSQANTSSREGWQSTGSTSLAGEPVQARDRPVYSVDYFTSAVTPSYLAALREEFEILNIIELVVPGPNDLPSRPPPSHITLSAEFFRAELCLPFHSYLRRALTRLNVAPMQLNANAYCILISCFVLWSKNFDAKLPFRAFQILYRIKSAPASSGSYYFQGYQGTFVTGCLDSDKQFKHLWFYVSGRWLHNLLPYGEVHAGERVPVTFRRGYVSTPGPHVDVRSTERIYMLREKADPEQNQYRLLSPVSLEKYGWFSSSSTFDNPDDRPRTTQPGESGNSSPGTWGPRVADENMDLGLGHLFPTRGLRIEEPTMAEREQRGSKLPSDQDRMARLHQKFAKSGDSGKGRVEM